MDQQPSQPQPSNQMSKATAWVVIIVIVLALCVGGYFLLRNGGSNTNNANSGSNTNQTSNINERANANSVANLNSNTAANTNSNTNKTSNINLANNANSVSNTNTTVDTTGWKTYSNDKYGYSLLYPSGITITDAQKAQFSLSQSEVSQGLTIEQVFSRYTGAICVSLNYQSLGSITISAPENDQSAHVICGRTGVGQVKSSENRSERITIEGKTYQLTGQEFTYSPTAESNPDSLSNHAETLTVTLPDKSKIQLSSAANSQATFEQFQAARGVLIRIIESYNKL